LCHVSAFRKCTQYLPTGVRTAIISDSEAKVAQRRFRSDVRRRRFRVAAAKVRHFNMAEVLPGMHGADRGLRTLDSIQLAVALDLHRNQLIESIVASDKVLCRVAKLEDLSVVDLNESVSTSMVAIREIREAQCRINTLSALLESTSPVANSDSPS
jgi:hypothetical protein